MYSKVEHFAAYGSEDMTMYTKLTEVKVKNTFLSSQITSNVNFKLTSMQSLEYQIH